jgi:hypothetical protein
MRVDDTVGGVDSIYDEDRRYGDEGLLRPTAVESWAYEEKKIREGSEGAKKVIPVKIDGLQRRIVLIQIAGEQCSMSNETKIRG